jgi:RNA 2',3'-cyclic 3'-phosphodiesterase
MENPIRTFICVEIPENVMGEIEKLTKSLDRREVRSVKREQLHITVLFFPSIDEAQIETVKKAMDSLSMPEFEISIKGIDAFGARHPNVLFGNINDGGNLLKLYSQLKEKIHAAGIPTEEKPYTPHLTVARVKEHDTMAVRYISNIISRNKETPLGTFKCGSITLKKSTLTSEGPIYNDLHTRVFGQQ